MGQQGKIFEEALEKLREILLIAENSTSTRHNLVFMSFDAEELEELRTLVKKLEATQWGGQ